MAETKRTNSTSLKERRPSIIDRPVVPLAPRIATFIFGDRDVENGLFDRYAIAVQVVATFIPLQ
jgi:hypothetical protein